MQKATFQPNNMIFNSVGQLEVNYDLPWVNALAAARGDGRIDPEVLGLRLPVTDKGKKKINIALFEFNIKVPGLWAEQQMEEKHCRPAAQEEVLAYCALHPKRKKFLVALNAKWKSGTSYVMVIGNRGGVRFIHGQYALSNFPPETQFLAVKLD
jgi:hypothetical protein